MKSLYKLFAQILVLLPVLLIPSGGEVCFRRHDGEFEGRTDTCRGKMRRTFASPSDCCSHRKGNGFALSELRLEGKTSRYLCTPCAALLAIFNESMTSPRPESVWSEWTPFSSCSHTCGAGVRTRMRLCLNGNCEGNSEEHISCQHRQFCPVDGSWGPWFPWQPCNVSCGAGVRMRERLCNDPPSHHGGTDCPGESKQFRDCHNGPCPVSGGWSAWGEYGQCSATCGSGFRVRRRLCNNPTPVGDGELCQGRHLQKQHCRMPPCSVDGGWSLWGRWSQCSVTCGKGYKSRRRQCNSPRPKHGGQKCRGVRVQTRQCWAVARNCPVNGEWSHWTFWSDCHAEECSRTPGSRVRWRSCTAPSPGHGGHDCRGKATQREDCLNQPDHCQTTHSTSFNTVTNEIITADSGEELQDVTSTGIAESGTQTVDGTSTASLHPSISHVPTTQNESINDKSTTRE